MSLEPRISLITLGVADVERSTAFYERLGWKPSRQEGITFIALKGIVLALFARASLADDANVADSPGGFSGVTLAHNLASEPAFDFAVACGARAVKRPERVFWGGYSGYFADPDGHLWELAYNPLAPLDAEGNMTLPPAATD